MVGVRGSKPLPRTITSRRYRQALVMARIRQSSATELRRFKPDDPSRSLIYECCRNGDPDPDGHQTADERQAHPNRRKEPDLFVHDNNLRLLCAFVPIVDDLDLLERHEAATYHFLERGKQGIHLFFAIDDFDHDRQVH